MAQITINIDTIPIEYRYSTYPCLCFLLPSISSSRRTPERVRFCQCIVAPWQWHVCIHDVSIIRGPHPVSHRQYMSQIHPRRSRKCSKSLYTHWPYPNLSGPLSLSLWLWLSLSLSHTHTHSLSISNSYLALVLALVAIGFSLTLSPLYSWQWIIP